MSDNKGKSTMELTKDQYEFILSIADFTERVVLYHINAECETAVANYELANLPADQWKVANKNSLTITQAVILAQAIARRNAESIDDAARAKAEYYSRSSCDCEDENELTDGVDLSYDPNVKKAWFPIAWSAELESVVKLINPTATCQAHGFSITVSIDPRTVKYFGSSRRGSKIVKREIEIRLTQRDTFFKVINFVNPYAVIIHNGTLATVNAAVPEILPDTEDPTPEYHLNEDGEVGLLLNLNQLKFPYETIDRWRTNPKLVQLALDHTLTKADFASVVGTEYANDLWKASDMRDDEPVNNWMRVAWMKTGVRFKILEDDESGYEFIVTENDLDLKL